MTNEQMDTLAACKFVVVLNRNFELSRMLSGICHVTAGLVGSLASEVEQLRFLEYRSADDETFQWISDWPFVVLKARGGQMRTLRSTLLADSLPAVTYLDTMFEGGTEAEQAATAERKYDELEIVALATFGDRSVIDPLTKKFSLWK